jgi:ribosomal protein S18 acetylase RimI-like enzyme
VTFRDATADDLDALAALHAAFFREEGYPLDETRARAAIAELLANRSLGRIAIAGERAGYFVLGYGYSLEFHGRDAFLDELYVIPAARGQGLGRAALRYAEEMCREDGIRALHLEVEHGKPDTYRLYEDTGFEDHSRHLMTKLLA